MTDKLAAAQGRYDEAVAQYETEFTGLNGKLQESTEAVVRMGSQLENAEIRVQKLTSELCCARDRCEELQSALNSTVSKYEAQMVEMTQRFVAEHKVETATLESVWSSKLAAAEAQWQSEIVSKTTEHQERMEELKVCRLQHVSGRSK
jgi:chromosome segregation ATPase